VCMYVELMLFACYWRAVDPLEHVLRGYRESLLQQAATALVTPPGDDDMNRLHDDVDTGAQYVAFIILYNKPDIIECTC